METEPLSPLERMRKQARENMAPPTWLGRGERRVYERAQKKAQKKSPKISPDMGISEVHQLRSIDSLLMGDDIAVCNQELKDYEFAQTLTELNLKLLRIFKVVGLPDKSIRTYYRSFTEENVPQRAFVNLLGQAHPDKLKQHRKAFVDYDTKRARALRGNNGRVVLDEESKQIFADLIKLEDIPLEEVFKEIQRSRAESIDLLKMQIDWLKRSPADEYPEEIVVVEPETMESEKVEPEVEQKQAFPLADWNLFWTTSHWSADPSHLVPISTTSKETALDEFTNASRGEISIKPASVLNALEFHLQKSVIQRALATRNKYGPVGIRDWVKIKRGKDRIFFLVSEENRNAVFFAAGRDRVYRDN